MFKLISTQKRYFKAPYRMSIEPKRKQPRVVNLNSNSLERLTPKNYPFLEPGKLPIKERPRKLNDFKRRRSDAPEMKKLMTDEEAQVRKDRGLRDARKGTNFFSGGDEPQYSDFYERIDSLRESNPLVNANTSGWIFNQSPQFFRPKLGSVHELTIGGWRRGSLIGQEANRKLWKERLMHLPLLRDRPPDPFRNSPELIKRISFKDPKTLMNFLAPSGKIKNHRVTGVSWKVQRKIAKEIKKCRFLGLFSFTSNPANLLFTEDTQPGYFPEMSNDPSFPVLDEDELPSLPGQSQSTFKKKGPTKFLEFQKNVDAGLHPSGEYYSQLTDNEYRPKRRVKAREVSQYYGRQKDRMNEKLDTILEQRHMADTMKQKNLMSQKKKTTDFGDSDSEKQQKEITEEQQRQQEKEFPISRIVNPLFDSKDLL